MRYIELSTANKTVVLPVVWHRIDEDLGRVRCVVILTDGGDCLTLEISRADFDRLPQKD